MENDLSIEVYKESFKMTDENTYIPIVVREPLYVRQSRAIVYFMVLVLFMFYIYYELDKNDRCFTKREFNIAPELPIKAQYVQFKHEAMYEPDVILRVDNRLINAIPKHLGNNQWILNLGKEKRITTLNINRIINGKETFTYDEEIKFMDKMHKEII